MKEKVREYLAALEAGDPERIIGLFEPDGWVASPFLESKASCLFAQLKIASGQIL